jgi:hypothetical protein
LRTYDDRSFASIQCSLQGSSTAAHGRVAGSHTRRTRDRKLQEYRD